MTAVLRAHAALREAGLPMTDRPTRAANSVNEVWFIGPYVLRINTHPDRVSLRHEQRIHEVLGPEFPAPELIGYGEAAFGEWLIVRRVVGQELNQLWPAMTDAAREHAITQVGTTLERLHAVDIKAADLDPPFLHGDTLECPHQLPVGRLLDLLARAARLPNVDVGLIRDAVDRVASAASALDDAPTALIHGDLHFGNVLFDGSQLAAFVDFEWTRPGPPDLDLDVLLHSLADPALHLASDQAALRRRDFEHVASWLKASYPALFAHPRLLDRLTVYRLSYDVRELLRHPPYQKGDLLSPHHPYRRIQRLVEGRSDLAWVLAPT